MSRIVVNKFNLQLTDKCSGAKSILFIKNDSIYTLSEVVVKGS